MKASFNSRGVFAPGGSFVSVKRAQQSMRLRSYLLRLNLAVVSLLGLLAVRVAVARSFAQSVGLVRPGVCPASAPVTRV